jgi:hypothetical protein
VPESLLSPQAYEAFIYTLAEEHPDIERSTLVYIPSGTFYGRVEGMLFFGQSVILCVQEYLNFELGVIEGYGYEVSRPHPSLDDASFPPCGRILPAWVSSQGQALLVRLVPSSERSRACFYGSPPQTHIARYQAASGTCT